MNSRDMKFSFLRFMIAISLVYGFAAVASGAEYSLFTSDLNSTLQSARDVTELPGNLPRAIQSRQVSMNPVISTRNIISENDTLDLDLFPGTLYRAQIDKVSTDINGARTLRGRIEGFPFGYVLISSEGNRSLGTISIPEKDEFYTIQYEANSKKHYLLNMSSNQLDILENDPPRVVPKPVSLQSIEISTQNIQLESNPLEQVTLDVMIVYTPAANDWANSSAGGIENVIAQTISLSQLALDNSETYLNLNLVYSGQVTYTESGDAGTDLERLTFTNDAYMNEVQSLRNQYNADVVALFAKMDNTGGIGWLLEDPSGNEIVAYSIVRVQQATISNTYIHEMGHNMGCGHHIEQISQPGPGMFSYSAGWRWTGNDSGKYCSIMTYTSGDYFTDGIDHTQVPYFSNPNVLYQGFATGDTSKGDNARDIREIKSVIAGYRTGNSSGNVFIDIGLRLYDGSEIVKIACEQGTPTSPLRISKFGTTYGISLVDIVDSNATGIVIQTSSGPKAIRKLQ